MKNDCEVCRYSCKNSSDTCSKFYPKQCFLGKYDIHFKEEPDKYYGKHENTSRICVVCKNYFHNSKIAWRKLKSGLYSFCPECAPRNDYIAQKVLGV